MRRANESTEILLERLQGLFERDPEEFMRIRRILIARAIARFRPETRARARGVQFQIDARLGRRHHPVARLQAMRAMFWSQFETFRQTLEDAAEPGRTRAPAERENVVQLATRRKAR